MNLPMGETVTLLRRGITGRDQYGNDVYGTTEIDVPGCAIAPRASSELVQAKDTVIVGLTVYMPSGTTVAATDQMRVRGDVYDVDGVPGAFRSPLTGTRGPVQVALTKVTG